ncbi:glycine dehydrogenase (aminomethyl-transferring), partial [Nocardia sp. NPDC003345]
MTQSFADRHVGPDGDEFAHILAAIGIGSAEELAAAALPAGIRDEDPLAGLPAPGGEHEVLAELAALAASNTAATSMIGLGYYDTLTPPVLVRNLLENPAWYTA